MRASSSGLQFVAAAERRIGEPFIHHFVPSDTCNSGSITYPDCMTRGLGLDEKGYDCSGLVVASLCEALDITLAEYPPALRHVRQMAHAVPRSTRFAQAGDVFLKLKATGAHAFIYDGNESIIHANSESAVVEKVVLPSVKKIHRLPRIQIVDLAKLVLKTQPYEQPVVLPHEVQT